MKNTCGGDVSSKAIEADEPAPDHALLPPSVGFPNEAFKQQLGSGNNDSIELPRYNGGVVHSPSHVGAVGNFYHERVNKVDAYAIFQYKSRHYGLLSKDEISVLQHCMGEVSKVRPQSALCDLELEIYTENNGGSNLGFVSGTGGNRCVAIYNEYKEPEFVWVEKSLWTRCVLWPWRYLMYTFVALVALSLLAMVLHYFVMPEAWFKTYVEGLVTVRSVLLDAKSDPYAGGRGPAFSAQLDLDQRHN